MLDPLPTSVSLVAILLNVVEISFQLMVFFEDLLIVGSELVVLKGELVEVVV
jgi:hypothetical protein